MIQPVLVFLILLFVSGCAKFEGIPWPTQDMSDDGDSMWKSIDLGGKLIVGTGSWQNRIWLDFEGATVTSTQSFIVERFVGAQAVIPAFETSDVGTSFASQDRTTLINQTLLAVTQEFEGLDVSFSLTQPTEPFSRVHIGGNNFTGTANVAGIAPLDIGNLRGTDVMFVFSDELSRFDNLTLLVNDISHEVSHALGARHIDTATAMLNPILPQVSGVLNLLGNVTPGGGQENSFDVLRTNLGTASTSDEIPSTVPMLASLNIASQGSFANLSVYSPANVAANPNHNLNDFLYTWTFKGETASGPTVLVNFTGVTEGREVAITVEHPENGSKQSFTFPIGDGT